MWRKEATLCCCVRWTPPCHGVQQWWASGTRFQGKLHLWNRYICYTFISSIRNVSFMLTVFTFNYAPVCIAESNIAHITFKISPVIKCLRNFTSLRELSLLYLLTWCQRSHVYILYQKVKKTFQVAEFQYHLFSLVFWSTSWLM